MRPSGRQDLPESLSSPGFALGIVGLIWCRLGAPWVSLGSSGGALGVVGFIRDHLVHLDVPWVSSGSSGVAGFTGVCPGGRRVSPVSLVYWGATWRSSGPSGFTWCTGVRPRDPQVHPGSLECDLGVVGFVRGPGFIRSRRVHWGALWAVSRPAGFTGVRPGGCRIHSGLLDFLGCSLGVVGYIRGRWVQ